MKNIFKRALARLKQKTPEEITAEAQQLASSASIAPLMIPGFEEMSTKARHKILEALVEKREKAGSDLEHLIKEKPAIQKVGNQHMIDLGKITEEKVNSWPLKYEKRDDGFYCKVCGSSIVECTCYVSLHLAIFDPECAGPGKVVTINYPYCPKCDDRIDFARACYHVDKWLPNIFVVSNRLPEGVR